MFTPIVLTARNPGPMTGAGNNTYLVVAGESAALIDAGVGHDEHLRELADTLASRRARLESVLVTHAHADHATGAPAVAARHGAICQKYPWPGQDDRYPVPWQAIGDGERVFIADEPLTAMHTPGHAPDHLIFWHEPSRTAFTGDLVIPGASVIISPDWGGDMGQYLASLEKVLTLAPARLYPAHGWAVDAPKPLLEEHLAHRRRREDQVLTALASGFDSVPAITDSIYDRLAAPLVAGARQNVRAHLLKLQAEGRAAEDDAARWRATGA